MPVSLSKTHEVTYYLKFPTYLVTYHVSYSAHRGNKVACIRIYLFYLPKVG